MCLILNLYLLFWSPLEQFEISSYNTNLSYTTTLPLEIFESEFYPTINFIGLYKMYDLLFMLSFVYFLQTNLKQKGYVHLFILVYILLVGFNFYSFTDFVVNTFSLEWTTFSVEQGKWLYLDLIGNSFEYVSVITSYFNIYSVLFCFIFTYIVIYLIYNKMLSNNTNSLIPNMYQIIGENLYKVSLNLFYSILGKHVSIPEFFIKINTIFVFLVISNVQGMIPYMSTLTSALTNTFFIALALFISIITTLLDKKGIAYFLNLFMPSGCPILLSLLIIPIEVISYSFRLVSLSVRLFANMMAGHTLLKVIVGFSWVIVFLGNTSLINLFPILILFILTLLEFGVALIQAYIFTVLSCIYLRDIFEGH
jgi:ATP synthase subunit 6